jgi:flagellar biosynthesis protein FliR
MLSLFTLVFCRVGGLFLVAPLFSRGGVPLRARVLLAVAISICLLPAVPRPVAGGDAAVVAAGMAGELTIGIAIGLLARLLLTAFQLAGEIIAFQMGFALAASFDPESEATEPVISTIHLSLVTLLFLVLDGHHLLVRAVAASFQTFPVGGGIESETLARGLFASASDMFETGARVAAPVAGLLLLLNAMMGFVNRITPQLSIFNVGFPLTVVGGLVGLLLVLPRLASFFLQAHIELGERLDTLFGG